jgi:UDPglucose--hexose-1-phosphate uridylyltransferase
MPELRTDWLLGRSVLVAENRARRPNEFEQAPVAGQCASGERKTLGTCPFCAGNEARTPAALYEQLDAGRRWRVRVVPNMYPAVMLDAAVGGSVAAATEQPQATCPALGAHEVIIESPHHVDRLSALSPGELRDILSVYAARLRWWRKDGRFAYGLVFKNQGPRAGASLGHLHSQLVALPNVPPLVASELQRAEQLHGRLAGCPYCEMVSVERTAGERIVLERDGFVAFCPMTSWQPYETWVMPIAHEPSFELPQNADGFDRLASVLYPIIARIESLVPAAAYNMLLRTAPWNASSDRWCHWRIEILPRINSFAGLEVGIGVHINPLSTERAAAELRAS